MMDAYCRAIATVRKKKRFTIVLKMRRVCVLFEGNGDRSFDFYTSVFDSREKKWLRVTCRDWCNIVGKKVAMSAKT